MITTLLIILCPTIILTAYILYDKDLKNIREYDRKLQEHRAWSKKLKENPALLEAWIEVEEFLEEKRDQK